jgi:hypothetical protein
MLKKETHVTKAEISFLGIKSGSFIDVIWKQVITDEFILRDIDDYNKWKRKPYTKAMLNVKIELFYCDSSVTSFDGGISIRYPEHSFIRYQVGKKSIRRYFPYETSKKLSRIAEDIPVQGFFLIK